MSPIAKYRERLLCIIAAGQSKAFLGKKFTLEYIEKSTDKKIEKYYKIYESTYSSLVSDNIVNGVLFGISKIVGLVLPVHNVNKLSDDLKNNFLVTNQFKQLTGKLAYNYGPLLALTSGGVTILNSINFATHNVNTVNTCLHKKSDLTEKNDLNSQIEKNDLNDFNNLSQLDQELVKELAIELDQEHEQELDQDIENNLELDLVEKSFKKSK